MPVIRNSSLLALLLALTPTLVAPLARAAPEPTPSEISVARRLFDEGKAAEDAGRFREAAEKFRKAVAIKDTPGIRFHLARCEEEQGALVESLVEYERAAELLESGVRAPDVEKLLPRARERVQAKVASLVVTLPDGVQGAVVELDGKTLSASVLGVAIPMNPGKHQLRASAPGRVSFVSELKLVTGEASRVEVELRAVPSTPSPSSAPPVVASSGTTLERRPEARADHSSETARTVALVSEAGLFAAGLTTGIVFLVAKGGADDRYRTANDLVLSQVGGSDPNGTACSIPRDGCADLEDARRESSRHGTLSTVGFVTAGVSAAAFGLTLILWKTEPPVRAQASLGPGRAVLSVSARF